MEVTELVRRYPRLYHMASDGSWPSIAERGLLSVTALLDLYAVPEPRRSEIEAARRPDSVVLDDPVLGRAVIRDNKPLLESRLQSCLQGGMTPVDWYRLLNRRTFFWPTLERVERLLGAAAYRESPQIVLMVNTEALVDGREDRIELSPINSGATRPFAWPRGPETFRPVADFDFEARRHRGSAAIAEVTADYSVEDIVGALESVVRHHPEGEAEVLWVADR